MIHKIGMAFLRMFCRPISMPDYAMKSVHYDDAEVMAHTAVFSNFGDAIHNKDVADFGCGYGYQTLAMARRGARSVTGVEINEEVLTTARALVGGSDANVHFVDKLVGQYDVIYSQNSFDFGAFEN